jgi:hypothetical protein
VGWRQLAAGVGYARLVKVGLPVTPNCAAASPRPVREQPTVAGVVAGVVAAQRAGSVRAGAAEDQHPMIPAGLRDALEKAAARADGDEPFRTAFFENPAGTLEREYGVELREGLDRDGLRVKVQQRFGAAPADGSLSDSQLDAVSGGLCLECSCWCFP